MNPMKPVQIFSRINFPLFALAAVLTAMLLFAGCATTERSNADHSGHQSSCH
jgi:outer membrane murein-binding lipoprotein Lpp